MLNTTSSVSVQNRRSRRLHGILVVANSYDRTYAHWSVENAYFHASLLSNGTGLKFSTSPILVNGDLAGCPIRDQDAEELHWNPFRKPHPYTGCLYFDAFDFFADDGAHYTREEQNVWTFVNYDRLNRDLIYRECGLAQSNTSLH
jgi:hypothetical protein